MIRRSTDSGLSIRSDRVHDAPATYHPRCPQAEGTLAGHLPGWLPLAFYLALQCHDQPDGGIGYPATTLGLIADPTVVFRMLIVKPRSHAAPALVAAALGFGCANDLAAGVTGDLA